MGGRWERGGCTGKYKPLEGALAEESTERLSQATSTSVAQCLCTSALHCASALRLRTALRLCHRTASLHHTAPLHCTSAPHLCTTLRLCTAPCWIRMVAPRRCWASLFSLTCCLALLQGQLLGAAPLHPKYPGDDAPMEDLVQFYQELQQYLNMVTRPRYGKRSSSRTLCGDPSDPSGC